MRLFKSTRSRWYLLALAWTLLAIIGFGGFRQQADDSGTGRSNLEIVYLLIQLTTLEFKASSEFLNWRLQIVRFAAPAMAAGTVLQTASLVFADRFRRFRLRFVRDHIVVCGLDEIGTRLALAFAQRGDTVVAVESNGSMPGVATAREAGVTVLVGDPTDPAQLRAARVTRALQAVVVSGDDATNVRIAMNAVDVVGDRHENAVRCAVHLTNAELAMLLRATDLHGRGGVRMSFFNTHERAARALLAEHPPFGIDGRTGDQPTAHVVVFGLGQFGRSVVVNLAQQWVEVQPGTRLRMTLVDSFATGRWEALRLQHPALTAACDAKLVDFNIDEPTAASVTALRELFASSGDGSPTWIVVGYVDETQAVSTAFFVTHSLGARSTPLIVRTLTEDGLAALLSPANTATESFPAVRAFPFLDRTCTTAAVESGLREQLARAVHEDYLAHAVRGPADPAGSGAGSGAGGPTLRRPWDDLDDDQRDLSRRRVDGILADLAAVGCEISPLRSWGDPLTELSSAELDVMASREHQRWYDDRTSRGWSYGTARDDATKRNPLLVPWAELPADAQAMNLEMAASLPTMLARAGFEAVRR